MKEIIKSSVSVKPTRQAETKIVNGKTIKSCQKEAMLVEGWLFKQRKSVCSSKMQIITLKSFVKHCNVVNRNTRFPVKYWQC